LSCNNYAFRLRRVVACFYLLVPDCSLSAALDFRFSVGAFNEFCAVIWIRVVRWISRFERGALDVRNEVVLTFLFGCRSRRCNLGSSSVRTRSEVSCCRSRCILSRSDCRFCFRSFLRGNESCSREEEETQGNLYRKFRHDESAKA